MLVLRGLIRVHYLGSSKLLVEHQQSWSRMSRLLRPRAPGIWHLHDSSQRHFFQRPREIAGRNRGIPQRSFGMVQRCLTRNQSSVCDAMHSTFQTYKSAHSCCQLPKHHSTRASLSRPPTSSAAIRKCTLLFRGKTNRLTTVACAVASLLPNQVCGACPADQLPKN